MTLNSRLQRRKQRAVVARSVLVDEVTQAYERLHATVSLGVLHQAVERFRFAVPEGFEITEVGVAPLGPLGGAGRGASEDPRRAAARADRPRPSC